MGQCQSYYKVLVLGLGECGKSTFLLRLEELTTTGHLTERKPPPTSIFMSVLIRWGANVLLMKEIAGHKRNDWTTYLEDVHGLIYMFDMSLESHKEEMKALQEVLFYEENGTRVLAGVPVLLVLNKSQLFVRSTPSDSDASNKIVRALTEDYLACFQKEGSDAVANPFQIIWTDSITGGGIDVDRLDWFVETISIRQNPGMLGAIRSVIG